MSNMYILGECDAYNTLTSWNCELKMSNMETLQLVIAVQIKSAQMIFLTRFSQVNVSPHELEQVSVM